MLFLFFFSLKEIFFKTSAMLSSGINEICFASPVPNESIFTLSECLFVPMICPKFAWFGWSYFFVFLAFDLIMQVHGRMMMMKSRPASHFQNNRIFWSHTFVLLFSLFCFVLKDEKILRNSGRWDKTFPLNRSFIETPYY